MLEVNALGEKSLPSQNQVLEDLLVKLNNLKSKQIEVSGDIFYKGIGMEVVKTNYIFEDLCHTRNLPFFLEHGYLKEGDYRETSDYMVLIPIKPINIHCEYIDKNGTIRPFTMPYERFLKHGEKDEETPQLLHED